MFLVLFLKHIICLSQVWIFSDFGGCGDEPTRCYVAIIAPKLSTAELSAAENCGQKLAQKLLDDGAEKILAAAKAENDKK